MNRHFLLLLLQLGLRKLASNKRTIIDTTFMPPSTSQRPLPPDYCIQACDAFSTHCHSLCQNAEDSDLSKLKKRLS